MNLEEQYSTGDWADRNGPDWKARAEAAEAKLAALDPDKIVEAVWDDGADVRTWWCHKCEDFTSCIFDGVCPECGTTGCEEHRYYTRAAIERAVKDVMGAYD